jgi:hypothetical protein
MQYGLMNKISAHIFIQLQFGLNEYNSAMCKPSSFFPLLMFTNFGIKIATTIRCRRLVF